MTNDMGIFKTVTSTMVVCALLSLPTFASEASAQSVPNFTNNRAQAIGELTDARVVEVLREDGKVAMSGAFFEHDSATLNNSAPLVLFKLAKALEGEPDVRLAIVGHTDSTGDFNYNVDLSQRRAATVRNTLLGEPYNISEERLVAMGAGPIKPVASNLSEEGRALNRRVVFVLLGEHFKEN